MIYFSLVYWCGACNYNCYVCAAFICLIHSYSWVSWELCICTCNFRVDSVFLCLSKHRPAVSWSFSFIQDKKGIIQISLACFPNFCKTFIYLLWCTNHCFQSHWGKHLMLPFFFYPIQKFVVNVPKYNWCLSCTLWCWFVFQKDLKLCDWTN